MDEQDLEKLKDIGSSIRRLNSKIKLLALLERAKNEYDQYKLDDCERTCRDTLKKFPKNPIALRGLGCVFQARGNNKKAIKFYTEALENSKNKEIEYTLIGTVYYIEENLEDAIKYYNLAINANEDYDSAYEGRNQAMLENHLKILDLQDSLIKRNIF